MDVSEMVKELIQISNSIKCPAAGMATVPLIGFAKAQVAKNVRFPVAYVHVLLKAVLRGSIFVTETFRAETRSNEGVTELGDVTLQWQRPETPVGLHMFTRMTPPGVFTVEPLKAQETEF
jgi:hypothetical protein